MFIQRTRLWLWMEKGKTLLAKRGSLDDEEHLGSLCWLVDKADFPSQANLVLEYVTVERPVKVNLPGAKQRKVETVRWEHQEMPSVPRLVNKKPHGEAHTASCVRTMSER